MDIALCDDEKVLLKILQKQLEMEPMVEHITTFTDLDTFISALEKGARYDAVLMDILWNEHASGIQVAEKLYELYPNTKVIYITGYSDRFSQSIFLNKANLSGFLVKPVSKELLRANLQKVANTLPYQEEPALILSRQGAPISIPFREIYYIESWGHTVEVHVAGEKVRAYESLKGVLDKLPAGFCQCHKSFIVNLRQVQRFLPNAILLKHGQSVPVSRSRYAETKRAYFDFMGRQF